MFALPSFSPIVYATPSTPWTPANASPWAWWDFSNSGNTIDANAYATLLDKTGNGRNLTNPAAANRPTAATLNGLSVGSFNGTSHRLAASISGSTFTGFHGFALVNFQAAATLTPLRRILTCFNSSGTDTNATNAFIPLAKRSGTAHITYQIGSNAGTFAPFSNTEWFLGETLHSGSTGQALANGGGAATQGSAFGSRLIDRLVLGTNGVQTGSFWQGLMAEVVLFSSQQSVDITQRVQGYVLHKWNLAPLLPTAHPYRNNPPTV